MHAAAAAKSLQSCPALRSHRRPPARLPPPRDAPGDSAGVGSTAFSAPTRRLELFRPGNKRYHALQGWLLRPLVPSPRTCSSRPRCAHRAPPPRFGYGFHLMRCLNFPSGAGGQEPAGRGRRRTRCVDASPRKLPQNASKLLIW